MKRIKIVIIVFSFFSSLLFSQEDTLIVENETNNKVKDKYDRIYKLFIQDKREIKHLWKVNLLDFGFLGPNIGFETKLGRNFSLDNYLKLSYGNNSSVGLKGLYSNGYFLPSEYGYSILGSNLKFYHNYKKREKRGKSINGFSANYFSIGFTTAAGFYKRFRYSNLNIYSYSLRKVSHISYEFNFMYGMQRRIGNIGYVEPFMGLSIYKTEFISDNGRSSIPIEIAPTLGLKAGFAIDSFKDLRKRK